MNLTKILLELKDFVEIWFSGSNEIATYVLSEASLLVTSRKGKVEDDKESEQDSYWV